VKKVEKVLSGEQIKTQQGWTRVDGVGEQADGKVRVYMEGAGMGRQYDVGTEVEVR
jgi:hypothetical protein